MKIDQRTPTMLLIRDRALPRVLVGSVVAAAGCYLALLTVGQYGWMQLALGGWVVFLVAAAFALVGFRMVATAASRTIILDRDANTITLTERRLRRRQVRRLRFRAVDDVVMQEAVFYGGRFPGLQYRVAFQCADGSTVPWTPHFSPERFAQAEVAAAAREFAGWDRAHQRDTLASTNDSATPLSFEPASSTVNWGCGAPILALFFVVGLGMAAYDLHRVTTAHPVQATIIRSGIERRVRDERVTFAPAIHFEYHVDGVKYVSSHTLPSDMSASRHWAEDLAKQFPVGAHVEAWYLPDNPSDAYLVHRVGLLPYFFIGLPIVIVVLFWHALPWRKRPRALGAGASVPVVRVDAPINPGADDT